MRDAEYDGDALDAIAQLLTEDADPIDVMDTIAEIVRATGRNVRYMRIVK